jgi:hypothetical protein
MRLRPFVLELERRKRVGEPYLAVAGEFEASLAADERRLWTGTQPTQQLVALSQFEGLGIATQRSVSAVSEDLAASWRVVEDRERLLTDTVFMFGITHVPYAASAYYRRPIRPSDYPFEQEVLHHATQRYVSGPIPDNRFFLDLQAEVLVARGLLQIPDDEASRALRERLLASQHEDGSWGTPQSHHFIHATAVMIGALHAAPARPPR